MSQKTLGTPRTRRALLAGLALLLPAAAAAAPPTTLTPRRQVELALSAIETVPDRAALMRLHPEVDAVLRQIVASPTSPPLARSRALTALRHFPSDATRATLRAAIDHSLRVTKGQSRLSVELLDLQQALVSYAVTAGPAALPVVQPQLSHWNDGVRLAAAVAARMTRSQRALPLLQARLKLETSAAVKLRLGGQIEGLRRDLQARGSSGGVK